MSAIVFVTPLPACPDSVLKGMFRAEPSGQSPLGKTPLLFLTGVLPPKVVGKYLLNERKNE